MPFGVMLRSFGVQFGGCGGLYTCMRKAQTVLEVQVGGLGGLLGSMLDLVGHKWGFGRSSGYMEGVWKGLGWLGGDWGPGSGSNMGPT